jgi:hypothetical protein
MPMRVLHKLSRICAGIPRGALGALALTTLALFLYGCSLVSGTLRIEHDFREGPQQSTGQSVKELRVDLNDDSDFRDNQDKIKSVDEVGFVFQAINNTSVGATGQIWISRNSITPLTARGIREGGATLVVDGLVLAAGPGVSTDITYDESLAHEVNQDVLHELVKGGVFSLYGIASGSDFDITIQKNTAVITVTVEL